MLKPKLYGGVYAKTYRVPIYPMGSGHFSHRYFQRRKRQRSTHCGLCHYRNRHAATRNQEAQNRKVKHPYFCSPAVQGRLCPFFIAVITAFHWISVNAESLPDPLAAGWQGKKVCEQLHESVDMRVLRCTFEPGVGHERHFHTAHYGYALSGGTMKITDSSGIRTVELQTGSDFYSNGIDWHTVINVGETTVQYLIVEPPP